MLVQWNESLSVGITEIDAQHQKLISIINKLHDAMKEGKAKEEMLEILTKLSRYTKYHFKTEEDLFNEHDYPGGIAHKIEHEKLLTAVEDFFTKYKSGDVVVSMELMNFLKDWLVNHIQGTDMKYKPFFNEKGIN